MSKRSSSRSALGPQFPLYIPSKGRFEYLMTSKSLSKMGVRHYIVVEPQEMDAYRRAIKSTGVLATALELDMSYKKKYETCDNQGLSKSTGPGPARNFAWDHSITLGHDWHWVMDDNLRAFYRLNNNLVVKCISPAFWRAMEDFTLRYVNVGMAGPNYSMFAFSCNKRPPFITNTRIYSCNLIRNDLKMRWRGRYNEDTILSLDMLKAKWCTVQFHTFLQGKIGTQEMKGGNTQEFYHKEGVVREGERYADTGTLAKSQMLARVHPDVARVIRRYGRIHHFVDYTPFKRQKLVRRKDFVPTGRPNEFGMAMQVKA